MKRLFTLLFALLATTAVFAQGVTTSSMSGYVYEANGEPLINATVIATHTPSGTVYGTVTDVDGSYRLTNLRVGGPYEVIFSYTGFAEQKVSSVNLRLGERFRQNVTLDESDVLLDEITISARQGTAGESSGASTQIGTDDIEAMPTLNRNLDDFIRLTPQVRLNANGSVSIAGMNNRFNAIYIDGAVNNDVFGLSDNGANGGSAGIAPFSIDIIDQFQVVLSPYDVSLGGFAGGGINAVTKSGTNEFAGTAYFFTRNEDLVGKTNGQLIERSGGEREKVDEFTEQLYGFSLGGPIVKDKIFFFANAEIRDDETPVPFDFGVYEGDADRTALQSLQRKLRSEYGYDPGSFDQNVTDRLEGLSLFGKLDFNLGKSHRLTLRHQYTNAENTSLSVGASDVIRFSNTGVFFPSTTNSSALELNSSIGNKYSNNLIIGYTTVRDDRDPIGGDFPFLEIADGDGEIFVGSEQFSTANQLNQNIFTLTNNFKIFSGKHTFTLGTHNEFYDIYNIFIRQNFGVYAYDDLNQFMTDQNATEYDRSYSLVDDKTGDGSAAAASFNAAQLGFYVQDEWAVNNKLTLTGGLRLDIPFIASDPIEDTYFNETALPEMQKQYEVANRVRAGQAPQDQLLWSPRLGFEYDFNGDRSLIIRGGGGIFTSRIPFVWPGAMFNTNGLTLGNVNLTNVPFRSDINNQYTDPNFSVPSGDMNLFVEDFKYPQIFRANLGVDFKLPGDIRTTVEGIYTKTINNVLYTNINNDKTGATRLDGPDNYEIFTRTAIDPTYFGVYVADNTNQGYSYNLTLSLDKTFSFKRAQLNVGAAYTYGDAKALNEGTSSQNSSLWRGQVHIDGRNNPVFGRSDFAIGHRVIGNIGLNLYWDSDKINATSISFFLDAGSGSPYTYVVSGGRSAQNLNNELGSASRERTLVYIPENRNDIVLVDIVDNMNNVVVSADEQWNRLNAFIEDDPYLSENRGSFAEKNSNFAPWQTILDFAVRQDLGLKVGDNVHKVQLSLDVFNFLNLVNKDWGVRYDIPGRDNFYQLLQYQGVDNNRATYTYSEEDTGIDDFNIQNLGSRWRMRLGVRYTFN